MSRGVIKKVIGVVSSSTPKMVTSELALLQYGANRQEAASGAIKMAEANAPWRNVAHSVNGDRYCGGERNKETGRAWRFRRMAAQYRKPAAFIKAGRLTSAVVTRGNGQLGGEKLSYRRASRGGAASAPRTAYAWHNEKLAFSRNIETWAAGMWRAWLAP